MPCTPGMGASPCYLPAIEQVCALPRMLSASLSLAMLPRTHLRLPVLSDVKPSCSFLSPQGLHSNFWDQISRMGRQAFICHPPLLYSQGMSCPSSTKCLDAWQRMGQAPVLHPGWLTPALMKMQEMQEDGAEMGNGAKWGEWEGEASYK